MQHTSLHSMSRIGVPVQHFQCPSLQAYKLAGWELYND